MIVRMTADSRRVISLDESEIARRIIEMAREDDLRSYAVSAVNCTGVNFNGCTKIYEANAEIARNGRVWDAFFEGSRDIDIWINVVARTDYGFVELGAYLTDIWQITGSNSEEIRSHFYMRRFTEQ